MLSLRTNTVVLGWKTNWSRELADKAPAAADRGGGGKGLLHGAEQEHAAGDSDTDPLSLGDVEEEAAAQGLLGGKGQGQGQRYQFSNDEYVGLLMDVLRMGMGFMVCRGLESLPFKFGRKYAQSKGNEGNGNKSSSPRKVDAAINQILDAQHGRAGPARHDEFDEDEVARNEMQDAKDTQAILENLQPTTIDIWWLLDDGGLTLLVPHIMSLRYPAVSDYKVPSFDGESECAV